MPAPTLPPPTARVPARVPFRVHFAFAETVELYAASPGEARMKARDRFPPAETGRITKVKRVKENADA